MKMKFLAFVISAILLTGCHNSSLKEFQSQTGKFTVMMPGAPIEKSRTINTQAGSIELHNFVLDQGIEGAYMVFYSDYPENTVENIDVNEFMDYGRKGAIAGEGKKLILEENISLNGNPGRKLIIEIAGGTGMQKINIFLVGNRLYQVNWTGSKEKASSKDVDGFLNSFKLL